MRIRNRPWTKKELQESVFYIKNPEEYKGKWKSLFDNNNPLHLELGCGKGTFIANLANNHPEINYIAIDLIDTMLGLAKRNIESVFKEKHINNLYITRYDIERIDNIFNKDDIIEKIYINFCNPWPKAGHRKKRLTHIKQLEKYKQFLIKSGEIYFKTDDTNLFLDSLNYFENTGFEILKKTEDLENDNIFVENIQTEHEKMFIEQGIKIKALIAVKDNS